MPVAPNWPAVKPSKVELAGESMLALAELTTATLSRRASPSPARETSSLSMLPLWTAPLSRVPATSMVVQLALRDSSLSAQLEGRRWLERGSMSSRLLPPPPDHLPHLPPPM